MDNKRQSRLWDEEERLIVSINLLELELINAKEELKAVQEELRHEELQDNME